MSIRIHLTIAVATLTLALAACGGLEGGDHPAVLTLDDEPVTATVSTPLTPADAGTVQFKPIGGMSFLCRLADNKPIVFIVSGPDGGNCTVNARTKDCRMTESGTCACGYEIVSLEGDCTENDLSTSLR